MIFFLHVWLWGKKGNPIWWFWLISKLVSRSHSSFSKKKVDFPSESFHVQRSSFDQRLVLALMADECKVTWMFLYSDHVSSGSKLRKPRSYFRSTSCSVTQLWFCMKVITKNINSWRQCVGKDVGIYTPGANGAHSNCPLFLMQKLRHSTLRELLFKCPSWNPPSRISKDWL